VNAKDLGIGFMNESKMYVIVYSREMNESKVRTVQYLKIFLLTKILVPVINFCRRT
jgi:hypothetical protein